ncbi:tRNA methyltransferase [Purpureocillium lilacinum]|uniref:tRNA methyltransferase n=1 Tax=Purpureocillium lilacinum TaxID=33203 RepID=A0A179HLJ9_PURLI|nr:tRNA methyltransferase [Purpureocillium lilacinum]OAQ84387.1 tRNA methyltransferase [Purpureocillium lilacinum]OAQ91177.1 tRNA methyltransferase [Purpureocillium lilacinum]GJN68669.1 tRNA (guanine-N(7)-)-methyltransferase non-catalytic subunit trm82 [Purpureocillium lilacinum]GJN77654.1 tRNA (guanine-N(7)-)-methyltransferase non-catalytic subunit trm82 [Purpureocillium lilacinum]
MTKIPYNRVHVRGDVLFTARGGNIHSFSLLDGSHISAWQHPDVAKVAEAMKAIADAQKAGEAEETQGQIQGTEESEPPAKRQKREGDEGAGADDAPAQKEDVVVPGDAPKEHSKKKGKGGKGNASAKKQVARVPDRPVITLLTSTTDGQHVLAVSGHDKVIWVFEHDGQGGLSLLNQRTMPKRPCAIAIAPDAQIICADKFGDVYALPLIMTERSPSSGAGRVSTSTPAKKSSEPAANTFTVHSQRNLEALENQRKQLELQRQKAAEKEEGPDFDLTLLLGHVSMLTSLVLAESDGRRYIVTSDRDEHIRVSRYIPQAHVIEGFCLGHKEFVSEVAIPASRGDILISGGGDEELFVWDWKAGKLLSKASILSLAREIAPDTSKVAVTGICSLTYPSESGDLTYVLVICEQIKAIFTWQLTPDNILNHPGVIQLPANPLQLAVANAEPNSNTLPKIIVAADPGQASEAKSLQIFALAMSEGRLSVAKELPVHDDKLESSAAEASDKEIHNLLYTVENLRKQTGGTDGEAGEDEPEADVEGDIPAKEA